MYKLAADNGFIIAENNLGVCYENGVGVERDMTEAIRLYKASPLSAIIILEMM